MNKQDLVNKYISLHKATTYCQYSQEYLSLRARTGKLKAVKLGRNWMTKKEWLDEYVATVEQYKEYIDECIERKENKINGAEAFKSFTKKIAPPENLPIGELGFFGKIQEVIFNFPSSEFFKNQLGFGFATALVSVLIVAGCVFGNSFLLKVFWQSNSVVKIVSAAGDVIALQFINSSAEGLIEVAGSAIQLAINIGGAGDKFIIYSAEGFVEVVGLANELAMIVNDAGDFVASGIIEVSKKSAFVFSNNINAIAENVGEAEITIIKEVAGISSKSILATARDAKEGVENINYAGDKLLDCFVARNIRDGINSYSAVFGVAGSIANDIGNSGDSLMAASVKDFNGAIDSASVLTYIVGGAGNEIIEGSFAGAKDLSFQASKISSFAIDNVLAGKTALVLQASAFTDYSRWIFETFRNKVFSFGDSIKSFTDDFIQSSGNMLLSLKEGIVETFDNLTFAISEKTRDVFAFLYEIPDILTNPPINQIVEVENLSSMASQNTEGIVVIPIENDEEKTKEKIKSFFSDEVVVAPRNKESGIIIPVFKSKEGGEYMYMMVPINDKN
ncbi:MAG: Fic family protein [Parcubacteria group bacterium GW2011_GWA2_38_27]|nr:MAG: Fic family protein [Parcubacteria group bacterium GW2011_GWA2_38_27]